MKFAILLEKCVGSEEFQKIVPDHVDYLARLHTRGILIAGGPFRDGKGGMILIDVEDEEAARVVAEEDPFVTRGAERYSLRSWEVLTAVRPELLDRDG